MKNIKHKVDQLAALRAQIDALKKTEAKLENDLKARGIGVYEGAEHYANVFEQAGATKTDWQKVAMKLNPSPQLVAAHTKQAAPKTVLKLYAYKAGTAKVAA